MLCIVCQKLSPDQFIDTAERGRVEFHSACAICQICEKPSADQFAFLPDGKFLFIHDKCAFTPDQMEKYLELQHHYRPE